MTCCYPRCTLSWQLEIETQSGDYRAPWSIFVEILYLSKFSCAFATKSIAFVSSVIQLTRTNVPTMEKRNLAISVLGRAENEYVIGYVPLARHIGCIMLPTSGTFIVDPRDTLSV